MHQVLYDGAQSFNLSLSTAQLDAFNKYAQELIAWNQQLNLTRITEPGEIATKHFLDSLSIILALPKLPANLSMIDIGSGAGFPGLPLKIARPNIQMTLLEATGKKTRFLRHVIDTLALTGVTTLTARAEDIGRQSAHRERYDVALGRAVSKLATLVEYALPLVTIGGVVIAQKGQYPDEELNMAMSAIRILGGDFSQSLPIHIPGLEADRHLVIIRKIKSTPKQYPRRSGLPAKAPIQEYG